MLGKQSAVCTSDSTSSGGTSGLTFDSIKHDFKSNSTDSEGSEFSVSNSFLGDRSTPVYDDSLSFPLGELTHAGKSLNLFENTSSTYFLCDDLPEIGSFEDVDRMFRRSDSTFGLMDSKEDEFGWLSSSEYDKGESGESLVSETGFPCHDTSMRPSVSEYYGSSTESSEAPISTNDSSSVQGKTVSYTSFVNGVGICDGKFGFIPEVQMNEREKQLQRLKYMEGKRGHNVGNGINGTNLGNLPYELNQLCSRTTSLHGIPSVHKSQQNRATGPDSLFHLQNNGSRPCSGILGTDNGANKHTMQSNLSSQSSSLTDQASILDPGFVGKQGKLCGDKIENPTDAGGVSLVIPVHPGSSNVQESSMMNMGVDDISLAAASLWQLQLVIEWLDSRTKMGIRDSIYHLARSTDQRINDAVPHGGSSGGSFMAKETNKCTSLRNMQTGTNPVDRSITQLLFHQPSSSSAIFAHDV